ncbi:hypothetical protein TruAng_011154 [Truncatella angustata]|nr:hypothetical protein TruAng_011154 [Truncatella angustata]
MNARQENVETSSRSIPLHSQNLLPLQPSSHDLVTLDGARVGQRHARQALPEAAPDSGADAVDAAVEADAARVRDAGRRRVEGHLAHGYGLDRVALGPGRAVDLQVPAVRGPEAGAPGAGRGGAQQQQDRRGCGGAGEMHVLFRVLLCRAGGGL